MCVKHQMKFKLKLSISICIYIWKSIEWSYASFLCFFVVVFWFFFLNSNLNRMYNTARSKDAGIKSAYGVENIFRDNHTHQAINLQTKNEKIYDSYSRAQHQLNRFLWIWIWIWNRKIKSIKLWNFHKRKTQLSRCSNCFSVVKAALAGKYKSTYLLLNDNYFNNLKCFVYRSSFNLHKIKLKKNICHIFSSSSDTIRSIRFIRSPYFNLTCIRIIYSPIKMQQNYTT